ncbi:MAG TPA: lysophospholipid acyltransferase family protein [Methylomirabilota bacterium]|nr:lysophospholipid acyltransferase family protein [Methylomirabilota bacterium]
MLYQLLKPVAVALMRLYFRVERRGREHVPRTGPVLIASNHVSVLDPPLVGGMAPRPVYFLAKEELFRIPLLGELIRRLNARPVRRDGTDTRALRTALGLLEAGRAVLIFPEGTRSRDGRLGPGKPGAGMLAVVSGAPVVPVFISGTERALPPGGGVPRPKKVRVTFGPPLTFKSGKDDGRKERYREAANEMMRAIAQLGEQHALN